MGTYLVVDNEFNRAWNAQLIGLRFEVPPSYVIVAKEEKKWRKQMQMQVEVQFSGVVEVKVPDHLSEADALLLAKKLVLSRIIATTDNPDAPDEDAFDEYMEECSVKAKKTGDADWDATVTDGIGGGWSIVE